MFHEHSESDVAILLDTSASMAPGGAMEKFNYARKVAAALAYVAMGSLQRVIVAPFANQPSTPIKTGRNRAGILRVLDFSLNLLRGFGIDEFRFDLSVRDPKTPDKYAGDDEMWVQAEASLAKALEARSLPYERMEGEAVFYGPKIDIHIKDAVNRTWQCTTIQFDFNLPGRFDMGYVGEDGQEHRPYVVHRALLGSIERFYGILVEHYAGAFPVWLSPVQVKLIPIADRHIEYAQTVAEQLRVVGLRAEIDESSERMQAKIRDAQMEKVPYMLVIGDQEMEADQVNLRRRDGKKPGAMSIDDFIAQAQEAVEEKRLL